MKTNYESYINYKGQKSHERQKGYKQIVKAIN